jgi:hypothetical protein
MAQHENTIHTNVNSRYKFNDAQTIPQGRLLSSRELMAECSCHLAREVDDTSPVKETVSVIRSIRALGTQCHSVSLAITVNVKKMIVGQLSSTVFIKAANISCFTRPV